MKIKEFSLSRCKRYADEVPTRLKNAKVIHHALPEGSRARHIFLPFVMLPLSDLFTHHGSGGGIPQPYLREALLACEAAYQGERPIKAVVDEVSKLLAEYLPDENDPDDHRYGMIVDDE